MSWVVKLDAIRLGSVRLGAAVALVVGVSAAGAQVPQANPNDVKTLQECLKKLQDTNAEDCTGSVVGVCVPDPEKASEAQTLLCTLRESAAWDVVLAVTYEQVAAKTPEPAKAQLATARTTWAAARQQICDFMGAVAGDPGAKTISAACYQTETANRVYLLQSLLAFLQPGQPAK
jgi:uncharacterized protein YecT (DUF1311 family)